MEKVKHSEYFTDALYMIEHNRQKVKKKNSPFLEVGVSPKPCVLKPAEKMEKHILEPWNDNTLDNTWKMQKKQHLPSLSGEKISRFRLFRPMLLNFSTLGSWSWLCCPSASRENTSPAVPTKDDIFSTNKTITKAINKALYDNWANQTWLNIK